MNVRFGKAQRQQQPVAWTETALRLLAVGLMVALSVAAWAVPVRADTLDLRGTTITLQPTERPGAVAEVVMQNIEVNSDADEGRYTLRLNGIEVGATFRWNVGPGGPDAVLIEPPEGHLCFPADCTLTVPETSTRTLWIYTLEGVGM